jgi:hypothetical protein
MTDNVTDFFNRVGGAAPGAAAPAPTEEYKAAVKFVAGEDRYNLFAHMSNGDMRLVSVVFNEVISVAPDRLAFVYSNGVLYLRGDNVRALLPLLQSREVKELHPFDPARHLEPEDAGAVVIHDLQWRYPEDIRNKTD